MPAGTMGKRDEAVALQLELADFQRRANKGVLPAEANDALPSDAGVLLRATTPLRPPAKKRCPSNWNHPLNAQQRDWPHRAAL